MLATAQPIVNSENKGLLLAALSGLLYGFIGYFGTQLIAEQLSIANMLFWRFFIAGLWILLSNVLLKKKIIEYQCHFSTLIKAMIVGIIFYSGGSLLYFIAAQYIGTGVAMVVFFSFPIFVTLFAVLFTQFKMNKQIFLALLAVLFGLYFLQDNKGVSSGLGLCFAIIAAIFYASYIIASKRTAKVVSSRLLALTICGGNALLFFLFCIFNHELTLPSSYTAWFNILALGIIATALPIQLLLDGLKWIGSVKASILSVLEPVTTVIVGVILLHESLSLLQFAGVMVVLFAAILIQFNTVEHH